MNITALIEGQKQKFAKKKREKLELQQKTTTMKRKNAMIQEQITKDKKRISSVKQAEFERRISPLKALGAGINKRLGKRKRSRGGLRPKINQGNSIYGGSPNNLYTSGGGLSNIYHSTSNKNPFSFNQEKKGKEKRKSITIKL